MIIYFCIELSLVRSYQGADGLASMVSDLQNAATNPELNGGCTDSVMTALSTALGSILVHTNSHLYVITDAIPNDDSVIETVFHQNSYWKAPVCDMIDCSIDIIILFQIFFIYIEPATLSGCIADPFDPGYRAMQDIATRTGGQVHYVLSEQVQEVGNV